MMNGGTPKRFGYGLNDVNERMVPEEYKYNSSMISELIKQNKDLHRQMVEKQEEIDRLNVLIGSFRAKLIKYTELNKKMQREQQERESDFYRSYRSNDKNEKEPDRYSSSPENGIQAAEHIRVRKNTVQEESKIEDIYQKLELLTDLVNDAIRKRNGIEPEGYVVKNPVRAVSDDDIIISESQEFKQLQDQIDILKRKLLIKKENELRKLSLNKELADLMDELNMNGTPSKSDVNVDSFDRPRSSRYNGTNENQPPLHCEHCHLNIHTQRQPPDPKFVNLKESLETPTPTPTQTPRKLKREKDTNVANKQYSLW